MLEVSNRVFELIKMQEEAEKKRFEREAKTEKRQEKLLLAMMAMTGGQKNPYSLSDSDSSTDD